MIPQTRNTLASTIKRVETTTVAAPLNGLLTRGERCRPPAAKATARQTAARAKATNAAGCSLMMCNPLVAGKRSTCWDYSAPGGLGLLPLVGDACGPVH